MIIYFISSFFRRPQADPASTATPAGGAATGVAKSPAVNIFENGTLFDLYVYLSEAEDFKEFRNRDSLIWSESGLVYGDWYSGPEQDGTRVFNHKFSPSDQLKLNGSIYLHIYVTPNGKSPDPGAGKGFYAGQLVSYTKKMVNKFKKIKYQKTHNLLTGETTASEIEIRVSLRYWKRKIKNIGRI